MPPVKPLIIRIVTGASTLPPANTGGARRTWLAIRDHRLIPVPNAGHWVHHDQLDLFLRETTSFLATAKQTGPGSGKD